MPFRNMPRIGALACLEVKMIGKPYAGELHVRFDEGEQVFVARRILNGHEAGNGGDKPRIDLTNTEPVLYSTYKAAPFLSDADFGSRQICLPNTVSSAGRTPNAPPL
jgi:hypothetical protein